MINIVCDKCKKVVHDAVREQNYQDILTKKLCIPCYREFENKIRDTMKEKDSFEFSEYKDVYRDTLMEICD
ncbi:MAG: hypothetical protein ACLFR1_02550 [Spirochaetia bacterium]